MIAIEVSVEAGNLLSQDVLEELARKAISSSVEAVSKPLPENTEVGVIFADDARVKELNTIWRQQDKPTNVLSFAANDGLPLHQWSPLLGDIVLAYETIQNEADEQNKSFEHHLVHLIVHGFLHLLGYDHISDEEAVTMENLETRILAGLDIADPYASS